MKVLDVCEIFYSLQGESSFVGMPCVFIRLSGCNLRCSYCDTTNSYQPGSRMSIEAIVAEIQQYPAQVLELTGGEPLEQGNSIVLLEELVKLGYTVLLETNGSLYLGDVPPAVVKIVDVKCPGSGAAGSFMRHNLKLLGAQDELKFVLTNYRDYCFAKDFVQEHELLGRVIHFSPVTSVLKPETLAQWLLEDGLRVKLSLQLHKQLNLR